MAKKQKKKRFTQVIGRAIGSVGTAINDVVTGFEDAADSIAPKKKSKTRTRSSGMSMGGGLGFFGGEPSRSRSGTRAKSFEPELDELKQLQRQRKILQEKKKIVVLSQELGGTQRKRRAEKRDVLFGDSGLI